MKLIIDIPEEVLKTKKYADYFGCASAKLVDVLESGTSLPTKKVALFDPDRTDEDEARRIVCEVEGYNKCIDEMEGIENE